MEKLLSIEELAQELDKPNLDGWKLFAQSSGLTVYRRAEDKLMRYKSFVTLSDIPPELYYKVVIDINYRLVWDKYMKEAREISDGNKQGVYWQIIMPLFIDNRDYTFIRDNKEFDLDGRHYYYAMTRAEPFSNEPLRKKVVRIENFQSQSLLCSDGATGLKSLFLYFEDPRGKIPKPVWNWAAKFGVPYYAKVLYNACKSYPDWIKGRQVQLPDVSTEEGDAAAATLLAESQSADNDDAAVTLVAERQSPDDDDDDENNHKEKN